jgi:hypothetical protein
MRINVCNAVANTENIIPSILSIVTPPIKDSVFQFLGPTIGNVMSVRIKILAPTSQIFVKYYTGCFY